MATDATIELFDEAQRKRWEAINAGVIACEDHYALLPEQRTGDPDKDPTFVKAQIAQHAAAIALDNLDFQIYDN